MSLCCVRNQTIKDNLDVIEPISLEKYKILEIPNELVINYKNSNFHTKKNLFVYKNKEYVQKHMKWIDINSFKLLYMNKSIQCLHIKNKNTKNENKLILFSQCSYTNLGSALPFLLDLSNFLKLNILTYEYTDKNNERLCNTEINVLYCYLNKLTTVSEIILMGHSIGNIINMNIIISRINKKINKIKSFIMISPTWKFSYVSEIIKNKKGGITKIKQSLNIFFSIVNQQKINIFLIHGKKDIYVKYFLTLSLSQRIDNLTEWYPKNGTHYKLIDEYRTKLLFKIKTYLNSNYSLLTIKKTNKNKNNKNEVKYLNKKIYTKTKVKIDTNKEEEYDNCNIIKDNNNNYSHLIDINGFEKEEYQIKNDDIIYNDNNKYSLENNCDIMSFKGGDLIPSFKDNNNNNNDNKNKNILLITDEDTNSCFSFTKK